MPAPVIIVTGVSRGIGRAIAEELQSRGAAVVGAARNVADVLTSKHAIISPSTRPNEPMSWATPPKPSAI
jgi:NAD(P)-dependent dehydrogenase (short-subunit alcohol dehydrogenase family)